MGDPSSEAHWEAVAENWVRWARTPGHDAYWYYSPAFFDEIVPAPGAKTLDIGCGEGRSSRDLKARGHQVLGIDSSPTLLRYAREAARVLQSGGFLCISVTHPINDAGAFASDARDAPYVIPGSYIESRRLSDRFERDGLTITFHGWTHSLAGYFQALERAGLVIDRLREPAASTAAIDRDPRYERWRRMPMFLQLRAIKLQLRRPTT